jgi:hypothetical protein
MFEWHDQKLIVFAFLGCFHELLPIVLDFWGDLRGPWHLVHVWVTWPKTRRFCVLGAFSWAIAHSFGVSRWFTRTMTLSTFFRGMTKTSLFVCFRDIFVSYCTLFWGSGDSYKEYDSLYILERNDKKNRLFCYYGRFHELLPTVLGWFTRSMTPGTCLSGTCFHELLPTVLGFRGDLQGP